MAFFASLQKEACIRRLVITDSMILYRSILNYHRTVNVYINQLVCKSFTANKRIKL